MLGKVPFQVVLTDQSVQVTRFGGVSFLHVEAAECRITGVIKSLERVISTISPPNRQNADEIDSAGDNLSVEADSQANQLNQPCQLNQT